VEATEIADVESKLEDHVTAIALEAENPATSFALVGDL
jgi:hypothetical protein